MPTTTLVSLPNPTDFLASIGAWSSPLFTSLTPFIYYAVGITLGVFFVWFLIYIAKSLFG